MHRREFLKLGPMAALAGAAFPQRREFCKDAPIPAPAAQRIIDMHVHDFFQEDRPREPEFTPQLNNSRPDGIYQMNSSWQIATHCRCWA